MFFRGAGKDFGQGSDVLSTIVDSDKFKEERKVNPYYPFSCKTEWDVVKWLSSLNTSVKNIEQFLKLEYVRAMRH